jgi:hypothetical protein
LKFSFKSSNKCLVIIMFNFSEFADSNSKNSIIVLIDFMPISACFYLILDYINSFNQLFKYHEYRFEI